VKRLVSLALAVSPLAGAELVTSATGGIAAVGGAGGHIASGDGIIAVDVMAGGRRCAVGYVAQVRAPDAPSITQRQTLDDDDDGRIDRIRMVTDRTLDNAFAGLTVTVAGYTVSGYAAGGAGNEFVVLLTEGAGGDTGIRPTVTISSNSSLVGGSWDARIPTDAGATPDDGAAPVLLTAAWSESDGDGVDAGDDLALGFSEVVNDGGLLVADLALPVANDALGDPPTITGDGTAVLHLALAGTPALTPGGTWSASASADGSPSGIRVATGTRITDDAGNPANTVPAAIDIGPTTSSIALVWSSGGTAAKPWALGTVTSGAAANSSASGLALGVRNAGDRSVAISVAVADSTPSGWEPAAGAGTNAFLAKSDLAPATPADPASYALTLANADAEMLALLRSGHSSGWGLYFQAPTALTVGGGIQQTIAITLTAQLAP
jgi:hypothetical protein